MPRVRLTPPVPPRDHLKVMLLGTLVLLLLLGLGGRRQPVMVVLGVLLLAATLMGACGGMGGGTSVTNPGTPAGAYTLTVTGTVSAGTNPLSNSLTLTLKVQ